MDTPPEPGGIPLGIPPGLPSLILPHPSSDPTRSSRDYASTKLYTTTATTSHRIQTDTHKTPKLGDFSSLDLYSIFSSAPSSSDRSATSSTPYTTQLESTDEHISSVTTPRISPSERLPYNVLRIPKLGDFSSLAPRADLYSTYQPVECTSRPKTKLPDAQRPAPEARPLLGDFSKIYDTFGYIPGRTRKNTANMSTSGVYKCPGARAKAADKTVFHDCCWARKTTPETSDSENNIVFQKATTAKKGAYVCPGLRKTAKPYEKHATAERYDTSVTAILEGCFPSSSFMDKKEIAPRKGYKNRTADTDTDWRSGCSSASSSDAETDITVPSPPTPASHHKRKLSGEVFEPRKARSRKAPDDDTAFEYESESSGPVKVTKADLQEHPQFEKDNSALEKQRDTDTALAMTSASAKEDVHVFVDVSNIYISMMNTVKKTFDIPNQAYFNPPPDIDWQALSQVVLRDRSYKTCFAACSKRPGNRTPHFTQRLEAAGFDVKVLDRVQKEGRYVEKLVDETIQGRIGDTVENTKTPGTIIIVTGDGKPAEQAAGFKAYAEHALKHGWNVEVVCWNMGCSQHWKDDAWKEYGLRYRLIKLDDYLGDIFSALK